MIKAKLYINGSHWKGVLINPEEKIVCLPISPNLVPDSISQSIEEIGEELERDPQMMVFEYVKKEWNPKGEEFYIFELVTVK